MMRTRVESQSLRIRNALMLLRLHALIVTPPDAAQQMAMAMLLTGRPRPILVSFAVGWVQEASKAPPGLFRVIDFKSMPT